MRPSGGKWMSGRMILICGPHEEDLKKVGRMATGSHLAIRKSLLEGRGEISVFPLTKLIMDVPFSPWRCDRL